MTKPLPVSLAEPALTSTSTTLGRRRAATPASEPAWPLRAGVVVDGRFDASIGGPLVPLWWRSEVMPSAAPNAPASNATTMTRPNTSGSATRTDVHFVRCVPLFVGSSHDHAGWPDFGVVPEPF